MSAPEHPQWLDSQVTCDFSWLDDHCSFDSEQLIAVLGHDGLHALEMSAVTVHERSNFNLHKLIDSYQRDHDHEEDSSDQGGNRQAEADLFARLREAKKVLCPLDHTCECTQVANDDFKSHMDELLGYFANDRDVVAVGTAAADSLDVDWDVPDWRELEDRTNLREWDAMRLEVDYDAGTARASWGLRGVYRTVHLTRLRGQAVQLWANWCDYNSEHNVLEADPAWTIVTMTEANVTMLLGLTAGAVDASANVNTAKFTDPASARGVSALWDTLCALGLNDAQDHVQHLIGTVGSRWSSTLDELLTTVGAATAPTQATT